MGEGCMGVPTISIVVNERPMSVAQGITVGEVRDTHKPRADVLVVNGFPAQPDNRLKEGDQVILLRRGETPEAGELEALMVARHTPRVHERMKRATVGVAGLGGLGSHVVVALARMGIGRLILADFDMVEPTNLNRQQYAIEHLGMPKTEAMEQIVAGINPYITLTTHTVVLDPTNIPTIFAEADIVVECFDRAEAKAMLMQTLAESLPETYVIGASGLAGYGDSNSVQTMRFAERVFVVGDLITAAEPGRGLMAPRVSIAAGHQANLVVSLLMDATNIKL